jgi:hypothetical protein
MSSSVNKQQINKRIFQLEVDILPLLFPGHKERRQSIQETKQWIRTMKSILTRVDNYIRNNDYHTAEFVIYYDKDHVRTELYPFKSFVDNVVEVKQWSHIPSVKRARQQQTAKFRQELGQEHEAVGMLEWIRFHILLLRSIFEQLVEKEYKVDKDLEKLLPLDQENKSVYKHFWAPFKHPQKKPQQSKRTNL